MGKTLAEKILSAKCDREVCAGDIVIVPLDLVFVQDSTGPLTLRQFNESNLNTIHNPERSILFIDHSHLAQLRNFPMTTCFSGALRKKKALS